ncbi:MAG: hypothetical protein ABIH56_05240 [Candidatus Margulisiibacteriota bacterium]
MSAELIGLDKKRETRYYQEAKKELTELKTPNSRRLLFALLGIKYQGVLALEQDACLALIWKMMSLEKYSGIAVGLISRVIVVNEARLVDEIIEKGDYYQLKVSVGRLVEWAREGKRAEPCFEDQTFFPPSGD